MEGVGNLTGALYLVGGTDNLGFHSQGFEVGGHLGGGAPVIMKRKSWR